MPRSYDGTFVGEGALRGVPVAPMNIVDLGNVAPISIGPPGAG